LAETEAIWLLEEVSED